MVFSISGRETVSAELEREVVFSSSSIKARSDIDSGTESNYVTTERGKKRKFGLGINAELQS